MATQQLTATAVQRQCPPCARHTGQKSFPGKQTSTDLRALALCIMGPEATIAAQHRTSQLHVAARNLAMDNQQPQFWLPRDLLPVSQDTMVSSAPS